MDGDQLQQSQLYIDDYHHPLHSVCPSAELNE